MFYQPSKHKTSFLILGSLVKPAISQRFPADVGYTLFGAVLSHRPFPPSLFYGVPAATCFPMPSPA